MRRNVNRNVYSAGKMQALQRHTAQEQSELFDVTDGAPENQWRFARQLETSTQQIDANFRQDLPRTRVEGLDIDAVTVEYNKQHK